MILASHSPRRKELLEQAGFNFITCEADIDETPLSHETGEHLAKRLANAKGKAVSLKYPQEELIIAADTVVWLDNITFGKPRDKEDARNILKILSGKTHRVTTAVCIISKTATYTFSETSQVTFKQLTDYEIEGYLATKEPYDKAGAYGIQGKAASFVSSYTGDLSTIIGLPLKSLLYELKQIGLELPTSRNST